ncbi:hypothetical protein [Halalkalicoccus salilacus]|uniref:hypothetical protein n=1 Tax=Halalkalicoccus TaxID=332246 RepID=UPI002F966EAC
MLGQGGKWLRQNRPEVVFLPVIIYGYIYIEGGRLTPCWNIFPLGLPSGTYLGLAFLTAVLAAIFYMDIINDTSDSSEQDVSFEAAREHAEESGLYEAAVLFSFLLYLLLLLVSLGELLIRICHNDLVLVSILLFTVILVVVIITEGLMPGTENS